MVNTKFEYRGRRLYLARHPVKHQHKSLQAWDAVDEYLIAHIDDHINASAQQAMLILNDDFGALSLSYHQHRPCNVSDSFVAHKSCQINALKNDLAPQNITYQDSLTPLKAANLIVIKIPRALALLEHQLIQLQSTITPDTVIIAGGKVKSVTKAVLNLFTRYIGPTRTSLAVKKSRLIFAEPSNKSTSASPYPTLIEDKAIPFTLHNHANTFSRQSLDIGARLLLKHIPHTDGARVIDLGCGNGVLGVSLLLQDPSAHVTFVDESYMGVEAARDTLMHAQGHCDNAEFVVSNCLEELLTTQNNCFDLVLCNPPFHQQNTITDHVAYQMFSDSKKALKHGGELRIVGNRHLDYPHKLKRIFGGYKDIASNQKFSILASYKTNQA